MLKKLISKMGKKLNTRFTALCVFVACAVGSSTVFAADTCGIGYVVATKMEVKLGDTDGWGAERRFYIKFDNTGFVSPTLTPVRDWDPARAGEKAVVILHQHDQKDFYEAVNLIKLAQTTRLPVRMVNNQGIHNCSADANYYEIALCTNAEDCNHQ